LADPANASGIDVMVEISDPGNRAVWENVPTFASQFVNEEVVVTAWAAGTATQSDAAATAIPVISFQDDMQTSCP
jgi:hypothetical protein